MKIKYLSLLLILAGIIMISGCVDKEDQALTYKGSDNLSIFCPYTGHHGEPDIPGMYRNHPGHESMHSLKDAAWLLDRNIEKAESISTRLETGIERYKAEGKDVSRLEALLKEYNLLVEEAKQYRALADTAAGEENNSTVASYDTYNGSSDDVQREYLIRSQKCMIQANHILRDIFEEFRRLMPGSEELNSTSRLVSAGEGKAILMGSFTLSLHLEGGKMAIMSLSRDSEIDINGNYTFEEINDRHDKVRLYRINSADVKVSGPSKTVLLNNENITLIADGEGYAAFQGNGTYSVEEAGRTIKEGNWAKPFFEERKRSEEYGPEGNNNIGYGLDGKDNDRMIEHGSGSNAADVDIAYPEIENRKNFIQNSP
jgi:hypothetical protein